MARIHWQGHEFTADPVRQLSNGNWIMRAKQHGPRFTVGTEIEVTAKEIIEMAAAEKPPDGGLTDEDRDNIGAAIRARSSMSALDLAMAEERKTLPTPAELIAKAPKTVVRQPELGDD